jgi:hypothetical protein
VSGTKHTRSADSEIIPRRESSTQSNRYGHESTIPSVIS